MMKRKNKSREMLAGCRRFGALALTAAMTMALAACGNTNTSGDNEKKEWLYVPEFLTLDGENVRYYDMEVAGGNLCYVDWSYDEETEEWTDTIYRYSLMDGTTVSNPLKWPEEGNYNLNEHMFDEGGNLYGVVRLYPNSEDYSDVKQYIAKFDAEGNQVFMEDITDRLGEDSYVQRMKTDGEGRMYLAGNDQIWLFDGEGNYKNSVSLSSLGDVWINEMGCSKDGKVYVSYNDYSGASRDSMMAEIDFDGARLGENYENFPSSGSFVPGVEKDFLVQDSNGVYEYDLKKQQKELVLEWLDSDINGNTVRNFGVLEDGRIVAVIEDWENDDNGVALLTKKKADEVPQKETIVVATLGGQYNLRAAAVKFNKSSDKYHVTVKSYIDYDNWSENSWSDALTNLNNDITSSNCPDVLDLSGVSISQLAAKGVFEDLNGYLEKSSALNRSDYNENILNAYVFDGKLITIPAHFYMNTLIGSAADLSGKSGWTLEEMIAYSDAHPDAELFDRESKANIMQAMLMFNEDAFIDWTTGECKFDSDEFKHLLEFTNRFPEEVNWEAGQESEPTRIQKGEVLLSTAYLSDFDDIQIYPEMFGGEIICIGYPTIDGKNGHALNTGDAYAILTKAGQKDGAWEFIESILTQEENERYWNGFPTRKSDLKKMIAEATKEDSSSGTSSIGYEDGWGFTYHTTTQKEVDIVTALMDQAKPVSYNNNDEIMKIITEEAEAFYKGQKSVDEVAGIIQSRVKIYVSETK